MSLVFSFLLFLLLLLFLLFFLLFLLFLLFFLLLPDRKVYVSVQVGHTKKRTRAYREDGNPTWNEEFTL